MSNSTYLEDDEPRNWWQEQYENLRKEYESFPKIRGWVAVHIDPCGRRKVTFFPNKKPVRDLLTDCNYWASTPPRYESIELDSESFPELTWESEPVEVNLLIQKAL